MSYTESNWKTSYESQKPEYDHSDIHLNPSNVSSIYPDNQTMFDNDRIMNRKYPSRDSQALHAIQRKISRQKAAAEHRTEQTNSDSMFATSHPYDAHLTSSSLQNLHHSPTSSHSFPTEGNTILRPSNRSRPLHEVNDIVLSNGLQHQAFHQPQTRKITKIIPKENYSLSHHRGAQPRSASASTVPTTRHELTTNDAQRLKNVRRHEPAHVSSASSSKTNLITPDSWKTNPVVIKKSAKKKPPSETVAKPIETDHTFKPIVEQSSIPAKKPSAKLNKPKREKSATKPVIVPKTPVKPPSPAKMEKTKEEKKQESERIKKYIAEKRQEQEKKLLGEKESKTIQEKERKDRLKKLNEQIKKVAQQPLPPSLIKKSSASTTVLAKDFTEQRRERILHLLGPRPTNEPTIESHQDIPVEIPLALERSPSSSSSSSSSESIVEIQPPKPFVDQTAVHSRPEPSIQHGMMNTVDGRNKNLLRWALNLTRDCDVIENKFKYLRPDGTQPFDIIPPSHQELQHENGNLRRPPPPITINNGKKNLDPEPIRPSKILRPSGRLSHLNQNQTSEYQGQPLPGVGNLRDPLLERRIKRDRAATKIQAAYRSYTVRKSLQWSNQRQHRLNNDLNKRFVRKPTKITSYPTDIPPASLNLRFSDDNFTIGSTLLRQFQRNGTNIIQSTKPSPVEKPQQQQKIQKPTSLQTYSDDYENITSTISSTPIHPKPAPQKPRVIQQPIPDIESTSSSTSSSASSSVTPTPTPEPPVPSNIQRRRSISPPLPPQMSPDNGRPIYHQPPPPPPHPVTAIHRRPEERRYSPDALERQLNAELHLLDGVEASMQQVDNMERLRSVALAQQEVVSLAQVLRNKPPEDVIPQQQIRKSATTRPTSSSSSSSVSHRKPRSSSPPQSTPLTKKSSRHQTTQSSSSPSSSSESILTAREKRVRQKYHNETELHAYEKRLKDIEKKIRLLVKRDNDNEDIDDKQLEAVLTAFEIFDENRTTASPRPKPKSSNESSISEDLPVSHKSSISTSSAMQRKTANGTSEIRTETFEKESDISTASIQQQQTDTVTTDVSDIERRVRTYEEQLKAKKTELDKLKQRKSKDALRRQEDQLKKQLQTYDQEIETLRLQPASPKVPEERKISISPKKLAVKSSSSSSSSSASTVSTATKPQESSIAEDLPVTTATVSQSKTNILNKKIEQAPPTPKKERDFFDDDDEEEEEEKEKELRSKPLETPREERDTQYDAQSISIATDLGALSETDNDESRRPSTDSEKPILNLNTKLSSSSKSKETSESSPTTSERSSKKQILAQRKSSPVATDYDEDFSEVSHSPVPSAKIASPKAKVGDADSESIQEDIEEKQSVHDTNRSLSSKSSGDEQSEILVLVKKSANTTPRRPDERTAEEEEPLPVVPTVELKMETINNDDTSHDVSEDEEVNERLEHENKVDKITDAFLRVFIDEAIDQGKQIKRLKEDSFPQEIHLKRTSEIKGTNEWPLDDDSTDEDNSKNIETNEFTLDFSQLDEKNPNEPRVESPRKIVVEEPVKIFVPHTSEQVVDICHQAIDLLFDQNTDFSNRSTIQCEIPDDYFTFDEQDSDNEDIRLNRHAYCQMIFDLSVELLHEMSIANVQSVKYPDWQKSKLMPKRFYRGKTPNNRHELKQLIQAKVLEILSLNSRQITYSKWRVSTGRRSGIDKFETVLDEEIRRSESQWINYDEDCIQMKFDVADLILDQLIQESISECLTIVNKRLVPSSNITRL